LKQSLIDHADNARLSREPGCGMPRVAIAST